MTSPTPVICREMRCIGQHDEDGCIDADPCDPRCLGHFGRPNPCNPCPNDRCTVHSEDGHDEFCEFVFCEGHTFNAADSELLCTLPAHAPWCPGVEDASYRCGTGAECDIEFPHAVFRTSVEDGEVSAWFDTDEIAAANIDGIIEDLKKIRELFAKFETLQAEVESQADGDGSTRQKLIAGIVEHVFAQREAEQVNRHEPAGTDRLPSL